MIKALLLNIKGPHVCGRDTGLTVDTSWVGGLPRGGGVQQVYNKTPITAHRNRQKHSWKSLKYIRIVRNAQFSVLKTDTLYHREV
jgi:hypothetical protein